MPRSCFDFFSYQNLAISFLDRRLELEHELMKFVSAIEHSEMSGSNNSNESLASYYD